MGYAFISVRRLAADIAADADGMVAADTGGMVAADADGMVAADTGGMVAADTDEMVGAETDDGMGGVGGSCITLLLFGGGGNKLSSACLESRPFISSVASFFTLHSFSC